MSLLELVGGESPASSSASVHLQETWHPEEDHSHLFFLFLPQGPALPPDIYMVSTSSPAFISTGALLWKKGTRVYSYRQLL